MSMKSFRYRAFQNLQHADVKPPKQSLSQEREIQHAKLL